jgi:hypothetical protein
VAIHNLKIKYNMGLLVKSTENAKIIITGTNVELPELYCRIEFAGRANGITLEVASSNYASKTAFKEGANSISTNVPNGNFTIELQEGETQTIETALAYTQVALEQAGYEVVNLMK